MSRTSTEVRPYDFQRQETLERGRLRRLNPILEVLAHRIAGALTSSTGSAARVEVAALEQIRWEQYAGAMPEPTFLTSALVTPLGGRVVLHLPLELAFAICEIRLGGTGSTEPPLRPLTDIEQRLVGDVVVGALAEIPPAFAPVISLGLGPATSVSSSMFLQVAKPTELCLIISLGVTLNDAESQEANICLPFTVLLPLLDAIERLEVLDEAEDQPHGVGELRQRLLQCPIDAVVCFPDVHLGSDELLALAPGDIIPLRQEQGRPLLLTVGGTRYCDVVPMARGKRLACLVVEPTDQPSEPVRPLDLGVAAPAHQEER